MHAMDIAATLSLPDNMKSGLPTRSTYSTLEIFSGDREYNIFLANNAI